MLDKILLRRFYPFAEKSRACRKRRDKTVIGGEECLYCFHLKDHGTDKKGIWIKCECIKEAIGLKD